MRLSLIVWFSAAFFVSASLLAAQQKPLAIKIVQNVSVAAPTDWRLGNQTPDSVQLYVPLAKSRTTPSESPDKNVKPEYVVASEAGMLITIEHRKDHAEAVKRLAEIASEYPETATPVVMAGWPAIERRHSALFPQPGEDDAGRGDVQTSFVTTAIAVGATVVRFDTTLSPGADAKLLDEALAIARGLRGTKGPAATSKRELDQIQRMAKPPAAAPQRAPELGGTTPRGSRGKEAGVAVQVQSGLGELEVASNDGQHVVVAANSGFSYSDTSGSTWTFGGGTPCNQALCDGDPTLAVGKSGAIYYGWIGGPSLSTLGDGVSQSTTNGHSFTFKALAATCPGSTGCTVADQTHIAADRNNAATGGGDRVYNVWRDFAPTFSIRISCSKDSGGTWTGGTAIGAGDLPRVSVGGDGFVYVAWASGSNIMLHKYSNCDAGLTPQVGFPVVVTTFTNVVCPVPGLDRCNGRNILSSPKIAVDDLDPTHIFYAFATNTGTGNENIMVFDSVNGGSTFPRSVVVNTSVTARRYMPWISVYGGVAALSWYDRRTATAANNDLTRFYIGGVRVQGPNLEALTETDLSGANDAQCSTWPCATNATTDSESCSVQPQLAGRCYVTVTPSASGSGTPCDFSTPACPAGETCFNGRGCPKYGDYNGNAAAGGRLFSGWSSATPPASVGGASGAIKVYASADRIPSDFYVRDWNDSATVFDNGAQPSTHADFWDTSDIWNQNTNTVETPGSGGYVVGDPPTRSGSNYAYAQVSRRAPAMSTAPDALVTANFYFGDYGLGAPFIPIGSENVTLSAGDLTKITPAHSWSVPATASTHLCLAVEINGPDGDTIALPSVAGTAPGPADPLILADNNKAQRNLQETVGTAESGTEIMAMIRNAEKAGRQMGLRIKVPPQIRISGTVEVIGGKKFKIANNTAIPIGEVAPGEIRWVRISVSSLSGIDKPTPITIYEDTNPPANGFTVLVRRDTLENVARRDLTFLADVLLRLAQIENSTAAKEQAELARRASLDANSKTYADFLTANRSAIGELVSAHLSFAGGQDPLGVKAALDALSKSIDQKKVDLSIAAQAAIAERLDAHITALLRAKETR
jgi:hypothetical protein